ncbi:MAG: ATP synthase F1 subunit delta [Fimbriimonas sp.]|nr:ATP synthase F1 subunit delta [Fimbriimonas sp.]
MANLRVCRRYALALFETARKYDTIRSVEDDLNLIAGLLTSDDAFREFLFAPYTGREEKFATIDRIFSDRVTALTLQVLRVMIEKGREEDVPGVRDEYVAIRREYEGVVYATVNSAVPMDDTQRFALVAKLQSVLGKKIEAEFKVEPNLIGGVRVAYGNYVLDGSIRGTLSTLREKLRHDLLKQH